MAVYYDVVVGKTLMISGPANVTIRGGETPLIVDTIQEAIDAQPTINSITPNTAESGSPDLELTVVGTNFNEGSVLVFGDQDERTNLTADNSLTTIVKPSLFAPAAVPVSVRNGPARSSSADFTFTDPGAAKGKA